MAVSHGDTAAEVEAVVGDAAVGEVEEAAEVEGADADKGADPQVKRLAKKKDQRKGLPKVNRQILAAKQQEFVEKTTQCGGWTNSEK